MPTEAHRSQQRPTKNLNHKTMQPKLSGVEESVFCFTAQTVGIRGPLWAHLCVHLWASVRICEPLLACVTGAHTCQQQSGLLGLWLGGYSDP